MTVSKKEVYNMFNFNNRQNYDDELKIFLNDILETSPEISLRVFAQEVLIALNDVFCGRISIDGQNCIYIDFSDGNKFKLQITRD